MTASAEFRVWKNFGAAVVSVTVHIHCWSNNSLYPCLLFMCVDTCLCVSLNQYSVTLSFLKLPLRLLCLCVSVCVANSMCPNSRRVFLFVEGEAVNTNILYCPLLLYFFGLQKPKKLLRLNIHLFSCLHLSSLDCI